MKLKIVAIVGSIRKESLNMYLAKTMQERYEDKLDIEIADIRSLPHYDQDEESNPPQAVREFKQQIANADGVIILTPEYNWSIPGVLKNALDWASRVEKVFIGKPVFPMGVTMGTLGTIRAQMHLREILTAQQAKQLPPAGNEVLIGFANQKFDAQTGRFIDETTLEFIDNKMELFIDLIKSN